MVATSSSPPWLPKQIELQAWIDPVVETHGFGPRSTYVEVCWLPVLGPTSTWTYRRLGTLVLSGGQIRVNLADLADSLGLGPGLGRSSKLGKALSRLEHFEVVRWQNGHLAVRRALGQLPAAQLGRASRSVRAAHHRLTMPEAG